MSTCTKGLFLVLYTVVGITLATLITTNYPYPGLPSGVQVSAVPPPGHEAVTKDEEEGEDEVVISLMTTSFLEGFQEGFVEELGFAPAIPTKLYVVTHREMGKEFRALSPEDRELLTRDAMDMGRAEDLEATTQVAERVTLKASVEIKKVLEDLIDSGELSIHPPVETTSTTWPAVKNI